MYNETALIPGRIPIPQVIYNPITAMDFLSIFTL